ncbi:MAG TPA: SAM-dependent methyltransferase [Acidimicrobiales bacterium]
MDASSFARFPLDPIEVVPIGVVCSSRDEAVDDDWDAVESRIEFDPSRFDVAATVGLDTFSHVEVVFVFDRVTNDRIEMGSRHPRGRTDWPEVGIFAQRAKDRPNRIGTTVCSVVAASGLTLHLRGLDAIDGTPVLDVKPYMEGFGARGPIRQPGWATELMSDYW